MEIPFVGRDKEIAELKNGLEEAKNGKGRLYLITGPVGIGKTRLIVEITRYAGQEAFAVLFAHCLDEKAVPYLPITDVLEKYSKPEEAIPLALSPFEQTASAVAREKTRLLENYLRRLRSISQSQPVLFVLDDLQWADSGTLSFLHYLSRTISEMPILAIAAYAEEYLTMAGNLAFKETINNINIERNCTFLRLSPLGINEISIILGSILGTWKLPKELVEVVHERTGGNPLFVEEMAKAISEQALFDASKRELKVSIGEIRLPDSVKTIISQRLSRLDEDAKKVLRAAAILGRIFEYTALKNTLDMEEEKLLDILDKLIATGYIEEVSGEQEIYRFVHNPVYEVIYAETSTPRRRLMHKRAGIELEKLHGNDKKYYAEIGRHYLLGAEAEKGIAYKILAGEYALANYALDEALKNLLEAADALENVKEERQRREFSLKIHKMLGDCYSFRSEFEKAIWEYERALALAEDLETKILLMIKLVYPYREKGEFGKCIEMLEEAMDLAKGEPKLMGEIYRVLGGVYGNKGEHKKEAENYQKALEWGEKACDEILIAKAYLGLGSAFSDTEELQKAKEYIERGLEILKKYNLNRGIASAYNNLALIYSYFGDTEKALHLYSMAKKIYEEIGDLTGTSAIYNNIAMIYYLKGEEERALEFYRKVLEISRKTGERIVELYALSNLGTILQERKEYKECFECYTKAISLAKEIGERTMLAWSLRNIATAYAETGNTEKALEVIEEARKVGEETGSKEVIAFVSAGYGEIYRLLKRFEASEEEYKKAIQISQDLGKLDSYWQRKVDLARVYIDAGKHEEARNLLLEAREFFAKIGSIKMLRETEKELKRIEEEKKAVGHSAQNTKR